MLFRIFWAFQTIFSKGVLTVLVNKLISSRFGPQGLAAYGFWQSFFVISHGLANGSIHNGIIIESARRPGSEGQATLVHEFTRLALAFCVLTMLTLGLLLVTGTLERFQAVSPGGVLPIAILLTPLIAQTVNLTNLANGEKRHVLSGLVQLAGALATLLATWLAVSTGDLDLAIHALLMAFVPQFLMLAWHYRHALGRAWKAPRDFDLRKVLLSHGTNTILMLAGFPLALYILRAHLLASGDTEAAGLWEACLKTAAIVSALMSFLNSSFYLPSFAKADLAERRKLLRGYNLIQALFLGGIALSPLVPGFSLSTLLFSDRFQELDALLPWVALFEAVRGNQFFLTNLFVASNRYRYLVRAEFCFGTLLWLGPLVFVSAPTPALLLAWATGVYGIYGATHWAVLRNSRDI